jgi:cytochrome c-type biogenesis protein CcmH
MLALAEQVLRPEGAAEGSQGQTAEPWRPWVAMSEATRALLRARRDRKGFFTRLFHRAPSGRGSSAISLPGAARSALAPGYPIPRLRRSILCQMVSFAFLSGLLLSLLSLPSLSAAKEAQPNEDPQIEQRMKALTEQLRCLVCQNETLADSRADLAEDLRKQIREQMKAGKSDQEIIAFLTQRYGDFVLYKPPVKSTTYLLWFGPFVLLIGGTGVLYRYLKRRRALIQEQPLTADERKRAEEILRNS